MYVFVFKEKNELAEIHKWIEEHKETKGSFLGGFIKITKTVEKRELQVGENESIGQTRQRILDEVSSGDLVVVADPRLIAQARKAYLKFVAELLAQDIGFIDVKSSFEVHPPQTLEL